MIIKIAIADSDREYLQKLAGGLSLYSDLNLALFSDEESMMNAFRNKKFDIFLFSPKIFSVESSYFKVRADLKVLLDDKEQVISDVYSDAGRIDKYQRVSRIYKKILELYSEVCGKGTAIGDGYTSICAFYSPVGGSGKTTIALTVAAKLAFMGKRIFYISLEDIASENFYLLQGEDNGLSELMLHIDKNTNINLKIQGMLNNKNENLYYLNHFSSPNDIYDMRTEELRKLIDTFSNSGMFDCIVVDMGTGIDEKNKLIFEKADKIVVVERTDAISRRKTGCFFAQQHIINEYGNKMVRIINFDDGHSANQETEIPVIGKIRTMTENDAEKIVDVLSKSNNTQFLMSLV